MAALISLPHAMARWAAGHGIVPYARRGTEIVHRTSVTVRAEGFETDKAPSIVVDVQNDSARQVEAKVVNSSRPHRTRRERELEAQQVRRPLAKDLGLSVEHLWDELARCTWQWKAKIGAN